MTSPYTPEFDFTDWPNGPLQANLPAGNSPNVVLNRVEAEFANVAAAFEELGGVRGVLNALLEGRVPTTPRVPVTENSDPDVLGPVVRDASGGLVVIWQRPGPDFLSYDLYAARLDPARPADGFSPEVLIAGGGSGDFGFQPTAVALPNGELIVAYRVDAGTESGNLVMKRGTLSALPGAAVQNVMATAGVDEQRPTAVLAGGQVVFFGRRNPPNQWAYRRYAHASGTFVDGAPVALGPVSTSSNRGLHAGALDRLVWIAVHDGTNLYGWRLDTADGALTGAPAPLTIPGNSSQVFALGMGWRHAWFFYYTGSELRTVTMTELGWESPAALPGVANKDHQPAAVRDADGTVYLFHTRAVSSHQSEILLRRRPPGAVDWGAPQQVTWLGGRETEPHPALLPGGDLWLVYSLDVTSNSFTDLYATRIITAV